jgi:Concanavalin A-like lectin/glucanases superfamily
LATTGALLAFACSVYEVPGVSIGESDGHSDAGEASETAGKGSTPSVGGGAGTGVNGEAGSSPAAGGVSPSAGSTATTPSAGVGGSAGADTVDPVTGGAGGAGPEPDDCPNDPDKVAPGACGCGVPEAPSATKADCQTLKSLLVHRYDFEGNGTSVKDRVGTAHGSIPAGATLSKLDGKGVVLLGGGSNGAYVDLPNRLLSSLTNATLEGWVTWGGGAAWQRVFDFGDSTAATPENNPAAGKTYLFLTPRSGSNTVLVAFSLGGVGQELAVAASGQAKQALTQFVAVVDDTGNKIQLYVDGVFASEQTWTGQLSTINDVNAWLGRSNYSADAELSGVYHEFRMYDAALNAAQVAAAFNAGTDPQFLAY